MALSLEIADIHNQNLPSEKLLQLLLIQLITDLFLDVELWYFKYLYKKVVQYSLGKQGTTTNGNQ